MEKDIHTKKIISFKQLFLLTIAQAGGAAVIYLPGVVEAGRDVWISHIIASVFGYVVIYFHYLPQSLEKAYSMPQIINRYWGKLVGGVVNFYYLAFFFFLNCLIISDVYYFGRITMPETPGYVFILFFLAPAVYAIKLGIETFARLQEFFLPILILIYVILFVLLLPKLEFDNLLPIMAYGWRPVLGGAIPNMNFPYAQLLPIAFLYTYTKKDSKTGNKYIKYTYMAIFVATVVLGVRSIASVAAFDEEMLKGLTFPPFSAIRLIQIGNVLERLDALMLAIFYATTSFKFIITFFVICQIVVDGTGIGEPRDFCVPIAVLLGVSTPFLLRRFDVIGKVIVPYFFVSLPLLFPIPLLLFLTIQVKRKREKGKNNVKKHRKQK